MLNKKKILIFVGKSIRNIMKCFKRHLTCLCIVSMCMIMPISAHPDTQSTEIPQTEVEANTPKMVVGKGSVRILNAANQYLEVYNVTGVRVTFQRIENQDQTISFYYTKGCYIFKIGKLVRKVYVR